MKIEQVNENQIRCILTREDLEERKIKFSELTYGSESQPPLPRYDAGGSFSIWL